MRHPIISSGIYEFVFGARADEKDELLAFWQQLGFVIVNSGSLSETAAASLYGHNSALDSVQLRHPGCGSFNTGHVRLQFWSVLRNQGLGRCAALEVGSRWMGMYTRDILQLRDSLIGAEKGSAWELNLSSLVNAPLANPAPPISWSEPFVGLRETLAFGDQFRLAFIQRAGFERPGFGTFDEALPFKNTEGSHANIVQPIGQFSTDFYKTVFGFEAAPFGEAHDSGDDPATIEALALKPGQLFRVERLRAPDCPTGLLQVYSPYGQSADKRELSQPGCRNLSHYSLAVSDVEECTARVLTAGGQVIGGPNDDEFGRLAISFAAPDGIIWTALSDAL